MNKNLVKQIVDDIVATANDINDYFAADTPLECHAGDIGMKLQALADRVAALDQSHE